MFLMAECRVYRLHCRLEVLVFSVVWLKRCFSVWRGFTHLPCFVNPKIKLTPTRLAAAPISLVVFSKQMTMRASVNTAEPNPFKHVASHPWWEGGGGKEREGGREGGRERETQPALLLNAPPGWRSALSSVSRVIWSDNCADKTEICLRLCKSVFSTPDFTIKALIIGGIWWRGLPSVKALPWVQTRVFREAIGKVIQHITSVPPPCIQQWCSAPTGRPAPLQSFIRPFIIYSELCLAP